MIESPTLGIISRCFIYEPLQIRFIVIDSMIPIRCDQQELIIRDMHTNKTTVAIYMIINQKDQNVICVYVAIGKKASFMNQVVNTLWDCGIIEYTIMVAKTIDSPATL